MISTKIHVMCTSQSHSCSNISDSQLDSVSDSLSASANYLRKLVEGPKNPPPTNKKEGNEDTSNGGNGDTGDDTPKSTVSIHADAEYADILKGFTTYDSKGVDTDSYLVKRQAYDSVRQKYPSLDDLIRDDKIKAMKELRSVGFKYYSIQVVAFVVVDGITRTVSSKSHHRLERPSKDYLMSILTDTFNAILRPEVVKTSETSNGDGKDTLSV